MQFMMLIYERPQDIRGRTTDPNDPYVAAWRAFHQSLVAAGAFVGGRPLEEAATATTVRVHEGRRQVQDGPYAETKEQLGGIIILELPNLDAALDFAARCPTAATGAVEVRPISDDMHQAVVR